VTATGGLVSGARLLGHRTPTGSRLKSSDLLTPLVFAGSFALIATFRYRLTSDGFMTLFAGREVATHGIPAHDWLSLESRGGRWVDEQWLAQWLLYRAWTVGGYAAVNAVSSTLVAGAYALFARTLLARGAQLRRTLKWTTLALAAALPDIALRAQEFGYLCFALLLWLLLRDLEVPSWRRLIAALALVAVWANLHGSVLLGAGLLTGYCFWRAVDLRRWGYVLAAAAAVAAVVATPYGINTLIYYRATLANGAIRGFASEWQPASATSLAAVGFFALVVGAVYAVVRGLRRGVRPSFPIAIAALALTAAGFVALRWEGFAAFSLVILATDLLNVVEPSRPSPRGDGRVRFAVLATVALLVVSYFAMASNRAAFDPSTPVAAIAAANTYVLSHPAAAVLADDASASALLWLHPNLRGRVALDDRLELFPQATVHAWGDFVRGRGSDWLPLVDRYQLIVASRSNQGLVRRLGGLANLRLLYGDATGIVLVRFGARTVLPRSSFSRSLFSTWSLIDRRNAKEMVPRAKESPTAAAVVADPSAVCGFTCRWCCWCPRAVMAGVRMAVASTACRPAAGPVALSEISRPASGPGVGSARRRRARVAPALRERFPRPSRTRERWTKATAA
jgi:hypothetical protein